ncbi:metabotropic glutamate receptor-like protein P [Chelonus insularis]|uniref:metabotropic glutamate receptor-like protein P n=1 Tax=Chelonus insularis TaxID=460826 RepID=UPI001589300E|nr:metabotropic glutamate receptor-like protein P [Chelonus insularis]
MKKRVNMQMTPSIRQLMKKSWEKDAENLRKKKFVDEKTSAPEAEVHSPAKKKSKINKKIGPSKKPAVLKNVMLKRSKKISSRNIQQLKMERCVLQNSSENTKQVNTKNKDEKSIEPNVNHVEKSNTNNENRTMISANSISSNNGFVKGPNDNRTFPGSGRLQTDENFNENNYHNIYDQLNGMERKINFLVGENTKTALKVNDLLQRESNIYKIEGNTIGNPGVFNSILPLKSI